MPNSEEVTSRQRSKLVEVYNEDDVESWRLDVLKRCYPEAYEERLQRHRVNNRQAYKREMRKRKASTSTGESRTPEPSRKKAKVTEQTPKGKRPALTVYPGETSKPRKKTASSNMDISSDKEEDEDDGTEDALFVKRKKPQSPPHKPEKEYQIRCLHCKSYLLIPKSQMRKVAPSGS